MASSSSSRSRARRWCAAILGATLFVGCGGRSDPAGPTPTTAEPIRLTPIVTVADGAPHLVLRGALDAEAHARFTTVDPCVVRVHGKQWTTALVEHEGELRLPLGTMPRHDAVVGLSTVARAHGDAFVSEHLKAIVAAGGGGEPSVPTTAVTARLGLRAELTPLRDPCGLGAGDTLPVRLALDLVDPAFVTLRVVYTPHPEATPEAVDVRTRAGGYADVAIRGVGEHVISAVATVGRLDGARERVAVSLTFVAGGRR